jgi:outer membrane receptor for ferrienterochelin and colicins
MNRLYSAVLSFSFNLLAVFSAMAQGENQSLFELSFEELMEVEIISASNAKESISEAPATVIVLTRKEITNRGYQNLSEIFDDLPGMEVVRPYGDTYYTNYMRGYRYTIGTPFLVMLDGVILNSLYFGITTPMATFSLTNIDQVEVVYGPVSSVYGANAFMGVVNIISRNDRKTNGTYLDGQFTSGSDKSNIADFTYFYKKDDFRISASARMEEANLAERIDNNSVYWLRDEHYNNRQLWGDFIDNPALIAGEFSSYISNRSLDLRVYAGDLELAAQYWSLDTGYGTIYPGDKIPANAKWPRIQYDMYARYNKVLSPEVSSRTLLRYRFDGISNDSYDIEGYNLTNTSDAYVNIGGVELEPGETARNLFFTYWQTQNKGWELYQDFDIKLPDSPWQFTSGFKYTYKDLQKAYDVPSSGAIAPELAAPGNEALFPQPPAETFDYRNRIIWQDKGIYIQSKYQYDDTTILNAGFRIDNNSSYGSATTLRLGYVKSFGQFVGKILYGEAFQEPVPRSLYGSWVGSGSDPTLKPEESKTLETSLSYTHSKLRQLLSIYRVENNNTTINFTGGARNAGTRDVVGLDYHINYQSQLPILGDSELWAYVSLYISQKEQKFNLSSGESLGNDSIGDLAKQKLQFGMTSNLNDKTQLTLSGRYIGPRKTIDSNPIDQIESHWTMDANLTLEDVFADGISLAFRVTNLFNQDYYHPGIRDANSGDPELFPEELTTIGFSGPNNRQWNGSQGWYNSRLPQPSRQINVSLMLRF